MVVLCKIRLPRVWFKRCNGLQKGGKIRSERLLEEEERMKYVRVVSGKNVEINDGGNVEEMWKGMKKSYTGVCYGSVWKSEAGA